MASKSVACSNVLMSQEYAMAKPIPANSFREYEAEGDDVDCHHTIGNIVEGSILSIGMRTTGSGP